MILQDEKYVDKAEKVIVELLKNKDRRGNPILITTSQIRNLLSMTSDIYNEVQISREDRLSESVVSRINYLKIRFIYEAGRDDKMKTFVKTAQIIEALGEIGNNKQRYILFSRYMEALVAYHKFYGGKD